MKSALLVIKQDRFRSFFCSLWGDNFFIFEHIQNSESQWLHISIYSSVALTITQRSEVIHLKCVCWPFINHPHSWFQHRVIYENIWENLSATEGINYQKSVINGGWWWHRPVCTCVPGMQKHSACPNILQFYSDLLMKAVFRDQE